MEYLVRFVSRLKIDADKQNTLMMRLVAALTHQSVVIKGTTFPDAKLQFSKLRRMKKIGSKLKELGVLLIN